MNDNNYSRKFALAYNIHGEIFMLPTIREVKKFSGRSLSLNPAQATINSLTDLILSDKFGYYQI